MVSPLLLGAQPLRDGFCDDMCAKGPDFWILSLLIVQRGQVWQPQVTHFRHIYLIWLLASLFTGGIVCIQGWESGSPDL